MRALALSWSELLPVSNRPVVRNRLLSLMSDADFASLSPMLDPVDLPRGILLTEPDQPIEYVYFVETGIGSIIAISPEGQQAEAGMFGREGLAPTSVAMGSSQSPCRILMQMGGHGYRVAAATFTEALDRSPAMRALVLRYTEALAIQSIFTSLSNAIHTVDERLARWLLMCHDRAESDEMALTHGFLSIMLAVRRTSVTTALHVLEGNRFIRSERGRVTIRDRRALEDFAGEAYGKPEAEYRRLIGEMG